MIYLDHNATTPVDPRVRQVMSTVLELHYGNPASSTHAIGWAAEELVAIAREHVAKLIGSSPEEVVFTSGGTEANNLALFGATLSVHGQIVSADTEHSSVREPISVLERSGHRVSRIPLESDGTLKVANYRELLSETTELTALMLANNEIGTVYQIAELASIRPNSFFRFHCDAVQAIGKVPIDVRRLGVDTLSLSAHKLYGPKGIGALYIKAGVVVRPQLYGGGHESGLRAGTLNVPAIVGFGEACRISTENLATEAIALRQKSETLYRGLAAALPGLQLNGTSLNDRLPGNLHLRIPGIQTRQLLSALATKVAFSAGSACQSKADSPSVVLSAIDMASDHQAESFRLAVGRYTTEEDISSAIRHLTAAVQALISPS